MLPIGFGIEPPDLVTLARRADRAGLDAVGCGELASTEALSLMGAIAGATERIRLETGVLAVVSRSPALLAMAATTLGSLSMDRFVLGIGAGSPIVASYHDTTFERPLGRVADTLEALRAILDGASVPSSGGFKLRGIRPRPTRIFLAAMNERMFRLAAREADGVVINFVGPAQVADLAPRLRSLRREVGNEQPFEIIAIVHGAVDDSGDPVGAYRKEMAPYLAVPTYRRSAVALSSEAEVDAASRAWREGGRGAAAQAFPDGIVEASLAVGPDAIAAKVDGLLSSGCDGVRFVPVGVGGRGPEPAVALIDCLAELAIHHRDEEIVS